MTEVARTGEQEEGVAEAIPSPTVPAHGRTMPADYTIAMHPARSIPDPDPDEPRERRQPMRGFEDTYVDIIDYIVRITDRIWQDQDVGYIYDTYSPGCRVVDDGGLKIGVERVVYETVQSIHAFPDARSYADDIIWAGDDETGYATSHRAISVGHHTGPWRWGPPTGRKANLWVIANCVSLENEIFEEWVLHNTAARLAQCGVDVVDAARRYGNEGAAPSLTQGQMTEVERLRGGRKPEPYPSASQRGGFDVEHVVRGLFHDVFQRRNLAAIDRVYAPNVRWHGSSNRQGYGRGEVRAMARGLLATFPDLGLHVDEVYWMGNEAEGFRVAVRWTAVGTHRGFGLYGTPTGRRVQFWGLEQLYFQGGRIVDAWSLFNEFDVLAALLREEPTQVPDLSA